MPTAARTSPSSCANTSIPDFSHWKEHDPLEAAFARLLKDPRAGERAK